MKGKLTALLCACLLVMTAGCSLAKAESGSDPGQDRLVGVYASLQPLEVPMTFHNGALVGEGIVEAQRSLAADGKPEYAFPGTEGVMIYNLPVTEGEARSYHRSQDDRVIGQNTGAGFGDGKETMTYTASLAVTGDGGVDHNGKAILWHNPKYEYADEDLTLWFNPLYLRTDGSLYAKSSTGFVINRGMLGESNRFFVSHDSGWTADQWNEGGWSSKIEVTCDVVPLPVNYVFCRMDEHNRELERTNYLPGEIPEQLTLDCAWLLVEEHGQKPDGSPIVVRKAYDRESSWLMTLEAEENGLCRRRDTDLLWE